MMKRVGPSMMMKMMMMRMKMEMPPRTPSDSLGSVSIALLPFWCFDAKGGEEF